MSLRSDLLPLLHQLATSASDSEVLSHYVTLEENLHSHPDRFRVAASSWSVRVGSAPSCSRWTRPPCLCDQSPRSVCGYRIAPLNMNRSATSFNLLAAIAEHGHEWDYETLFVHAWKEIYRLPSSLDKLQVAISRLRKKVAPHIVIAPRPDGEGYILQGNPTVVLWERHRESVLEKVEAKNRDERLGRYLLQDLLGEGLCTRISG